MTRRLRLTLLFVATTSVAPAPVHAQQVDLRALQDEAVAWLQDYIRLDTQNPPGKSMQ